MATIETVRTKLEDAIDETLACIPCGSPPGPPDGGSPPPSGGPAWLRAIPVADTFSPIAGSSLSTLNPGYPILTGTINAYCGLGWDRAGRVFSLAAGGHTDSDQNANYMCDLRVDAPIWVWLSRMSDYAAHPTRGTSPIRGLSASKDYFYTTPDGVIETVALPGATHTYYSTQYIASRDWAMRFGHTGPFNNAGSYQPYIDSFNVTAKTWNPRRTTADLWSGTGYVNTPVWPCAQDWRTGDVYIGVTNAACYKWTNATNVPARITPTAQPDMYGPSIIDITSRNRWVLLSKTAARLHLFNLAGYVYSWLAYTGDMVTGPNALLTTDGSGRGALGALSMYSGMCHDLDHDRYIVWDNFTARVFAINPTTGVSTYLTSLTHPGASGVYNRMEFLPGLHCVVAYPNFVGTFQVMRTA